MSERPLFFGTSGPHDAEIVLVGESWGEQEAAAERPFVGSSGVELNRMLAEAGIDREKILCTNVVAARPDFNEMWRFFEPKDTFRGTRQRGLAPKPIIQSEVSRLYRQIAESPRKVLIATGNYALWCLTKCSGAEVARESNGRPISKELQTWTPSGIMSWRGSMWFFEPLDGGPTKTPVLPIVHPAAIMRQWSNRAVTVHDLKARVPLALKSDWRSNPPPVVWAPPTFEQARSRLELWLAHVMGGQQLHLSVDIETVKQTIITCLGVCDGPNFAMSIPFVRRTDKGLDSFYSPIQEAELVSLLRRIFSIRGVRISGQNFIYDTQYIQYWMGVTPRLDFDTMLAQNVLFPGTPKDLGYLSSFYCHYHWYWKEDHKDWDAKGTLEQLLEYNCLDVLRTWEIAESQKVLLSALDMNSQMEFKMKINDLCLRMMNRGIRIDRARRAKMAHDLYEAHAALSRELFEIIPQDFVSPENKTNWFDSPQQTNYLFYDRLSFKTVKHRKTGRPTVGKEARQELKKIYPEFTGLFDRLSALGTIETAADVLASGLDPDFRMRCSFNPGGTETHRLSSSTNAFGRGTNLQNLSKGEEDES